MPIFDISFFENNHSHKFEGLQRHSLENHGKAKPYEYIYLVDKRNTFNQLIADKKGMRNNLSADFWNL